MKTSTCTVPILFLVFNRPETTIKVFEAIRQYRPQQLFIAADGTRPDRPGEAEKCAEVRKIADAVDWPCEIKTLFREHNLGCRDAVSSAINWFFENVEEGIILEDDCLPHPDFFRYCQELLEYYRNDERVMHISGSNFQRGLKRGDASYYFSSYAHIWGWASWRRAWQYYDADLKKLDITVLQNTFNSKKISKRWLEILQEVKNMNPHFNTWDFQWSYTLFEHNGLAVTPNVNMISNIGFGSGTHTLKKDSEFAEIPAESIAKALIHPMQKIPDEAADKVVFGIMYDSSILARIKRHIVGVFK
ncbi:MAG: glycosyltransferase family A protein [Victivallaceae bacterium]|jgi:hypothetical protein